MRRSVKLEPGSSVPARTLTPVSGPPAVVPDPERLVHLQFRRFAGCPVCNLHLRSVVRRHAEIEAAGVREVVVFHSHPEELAPYAADLPFALVADPDKRLYAEFGVESAPRSLLSPRAWWPVARAVARSARATALGRERRPPVRPHGGALGLPADFLIAPGGRVVAAKYGEHVYDQWPVDELLTLAARSRRPSPTQEGA
ncbi:alkyl hydroperoxide reductase [Streptomyces carminius]|uniref:Alkyl hydroperoxide reductase n=1 Tax=Streptomyces carminius TaxID=2665496 RepID=A0A2M8LW19_9ACTN|nr:peroxiredoxin-like family protein [Streptomyces carminius]PJE96168.1 alkyl hydroperoxide reductase [Streptomyces carminius]